MHGFLKALNNFEERSHFGGGELSWKHDRL
jgi:hypothetical protein